MNPPCLMRAWQACERELHAFLRHRTPAGVSADDLLQDLFLKALLKDRAFCEIENPRAWLFEVARNAAVDRARRTRSNEPLPEDPAVSAVEPAAMGAQAMDALPEPGLAPVDLLSACLPRVLTELGADDREALELCDIGGMSQKAFAELKGLSLPGAKSRVQRARQRLRVQLLRSCQVRLDETGAVCCFVPRPPAG